MIHTIIFSYNRAIQLELLLKSISSYDSNNLLNISVLYSFSDAEHKLGYDRLIKKFDKCNFIEEQRFATRLVVPFLPPYWHNYFWWFKYKHSRSLNSNFRSLLLNTVANGKEAYVMFLTDDSMFFKPISVPDMALRFINKSPAKFSFSLRHGKNIYGGNYSSDPLLHWNIFKKHEHPEWNHPFSVDGHIYSKGYLLNIMKKVWFKNPNTLECNIACFIKEKKLLSMVMFNEESCLVGFELNRVQTVSDNHNLNISSSYLNTLFNKGYSMQIKFEERKNKFFRPLRFRVDALRDNELVTIINME